MKYSTNNPRLLERRRELRRRQTPAEQRLWQALRGKNLNGIKFFRQYSVGYFILDFYCPLYKLAIELDGTHHSNKDEASYDAERTAYLNATQIDVVRFTNTEIIFDLNSVLNRILSHLTPPLRIRGGREGL